ncbi:bifunctional diguanylate cyclase/phosphodiesterase [Noviherbaspirillum galbum]|uniref:EAL domain-containing protein n=1 Tax=Noviherbaspirillum galbum TaxID=2709383 RepID=A0A6B3SGR4_9BURK|nr:EAL domain-containing protein [Noviherbaspirillum galbum]NEX59803.1 EAL domain-containing protein [Noviherbaspirillum galbum]
MAGMHPLLQHQLERLGFSEAAPPASAKQWSRLLAAISEAMADWEGKLPAGMASQLDFPNRDLKDLSDRLAEAQRIAGLGYWSFTPASRTWYWSDECFRICDLEATAAPPDYRGFRRMVQRRDRPGLRWSVDRMLHAGLALELEFRLHLPKRGMRWIRVLGRTVRDDTGTITRLHGTIMDVTARKQVEVRQAVEHGITRMLAESEAPSVLLPAIVQTICERVGWACGAYWALNRERNAYERVSAWPPGNPLMDAFFAACPSQVPPTMRQGLLGRVLETGTPAWAGNVALDPVLGPAVAASHAGLRVAFAFPIQAGAQIRGVMEFFSRRVQEMDPDMLRSAHFIGRHIAQYLERRDAEKGLRQSEAHFRALVEQATDSFYVHDSDGMLLDVNQHACHSLGYLREELLRMSMMDIDAKLSPEDLKQLGPGLTTGAPTAIESVHRRKDGTEFPVELRIGPILIDGKECMLSLARDMTERVRMQQHIEHLAFHDSLTNLPNRAMFNRHLQHAIEQADRHKRRLAVLFVDLDRFKNVNDTLGHGAGDVLLQEMSRRISHCLRTSDVVARNRTSEDIVARLGGDEFVVLIESFTDGSQVAEVAQRILNVMVKEYILDGQLIHMTASIGISIFPEDGRHDFTLMKHADIAMYRAKDLGKNRYEFYSAWMNGHSARSLALESGLRRAIERNELALHYQAKVDSHNGRIAGMEALVRWRHPELGLVPPDQFIPLAEETGLIVPLSRWVLNEACRQHAEWVNAGFPPVRIAVNLSARQFVEDGLCEEVFATLALHGLDARLLELEITESMVMANTERTFEALARLRSSGIRIAIDDFGVGYSSLSQLKQFPVDVIKIDRSFIRDIPGDPSDAAITDAIIAMSKRLKVITVAEGVETPHQWHFLREHGCDEIQGYYFCKPLEAQAFLAYALKNMEETAPA